MKMAGFIAVFALLFLAQPVLARSGCCSSHQGVRADGCGCNDGTPLSSTCAPYYACTANEEPVRNVIYPTSTPYPTRVPTLKPKSTPTPTNTPTPTLSPTPAIKPMGNALKTNKPKVAKHRSFWDWLLGWNK